MDKSPYITDNQTFIDSLKNQVESNGGKLNFLSYIICGFNFVYCFTDADGVHHVSYGEETFDHQAILNTKVYDGTFHSVEASIEYVKQLSAYHGDRYSLEF